MKPLRLNPAYKDYIWGGTRLKDEFGKKTDMTHLAESWELSCHPDGMSTICEGEYKGRTLKEYLDENKWALGKQNKTDELPILIKLIDAAESLSVQVHPDNEFAQKTENDNGKTEMWYVIDAKRGANIVYGVKEDTDAETLKKAIENNTVLSMLDSVPSHKGSIFFVDAGTIHAIGKGNLIAEIQQNSNVTYRLYDYDRRDKNGKTRELHIEKGLNAANTKKIVPRKIPKCSDASRMLGSCEYFQVKEFEIKKKTNFIAGENSYQAITVVEGSIEIGNDNFSEKLNCGDTLFVPAGLGEYCAKGRGKLLLTQNPPRYFVGIDLGGTNIKAAVVDEYGVIYGRASVKTKAPRPYNEIFDDMALCARMSAEESGIRFEDIESVGIGCPGAIDIEEGIIEFSNNLKFYYVPVAKYMENALKKHVFIDNDANAAAWGEYLAGCGNGTKSMVMITLGTGVGGGIIIDGRLMRGAYDKGAEIGHTSLIAGGRRCTCGRRGCFEAYASATALVKMTKEAMKNNPESDLWKMCRGKLSNVNGATAFKCNDKTAKDVVKNYLKYLSEGIVNVVNLLQPEIICVGGGISHEGKHILKPVQSMIKHKSFARFGKKQTEVHLARLGNDAGIIGAALLWKNK